MRVQIENFLPQDLIFFYEEAKKEETNRRQLKFSFRKTPGDTLQFQRGKLLLSSFGKKESRGSFEESDEFCQQRKLS